MNILSLGEILWDVVEGQDRLGGAPFNFAAQSARLGSQVAMVSAVGDDERGRRALQRAEEFPVDTRWIKTSSRYPTGHVTVTLEEGQPDYVIHRPAAYDDLELDAHDLDEISAFQPDWVYFGTLHQTDSRPQTALDQIIEAAPNAKRFYDVNLRKDSYDAELLKRLLPLADVLKINEDEVYKVSRLVGLDVTNPDQFLDVAPKPFGWETVCITFGERGSLILSGTERVQSHGFSIEVADAVGAGDAFSAAFVHGLGEGWPLAKTGEFANRVGAVIASKSGATPNWTPDEAWALKKNA